MSNRFLFSVPGCFLWFGIIPLLLILSSLFPLSDLLLKDLGPIWLLGLIPVMIYMTGKRVRLSGRFWGIPEREVTLAGFPANCAETPRRCHRYFRALVIGVCLLAAGIVLIPFWAFLHNAHFEEVSGRADRQFSAFYPFEQWWEVVGVCAYITSWSGVILILYSYLASWFCSISIKRRKKKIAPASEAGE